jgi:hypothetical protein
MTPLETREAEKELKKAAQEYAQDFIGIQPVQRMAFKAGAEYQAAITREETIAEVLKLLKELKK